MDSMKPNVLFIMADQFRWDYLGCAGNEFVRTPHIDRIAASGVRFTQATTNAPVCAPARIGLACGQRPVRVGAWDNNAFLPPEYPTYYQRFRDSGYRVGCSGKLDLAKPRGYNGARGDRPDLFRWGFTHPIEIEGKMHAGSSPTPRGPYGFWLQEQGLYEKFHEDYVRRSRSGYSDDESFDSVLPTEAFADSYVGRRTCEWLEEDPGDFPWYFFVSFPGPHNPFDPPTEYADRWRDAAMPPRIIDDLTGKPEERKKRIVTKSDEEWTHAQRQYCAYIELIDDWIGRILETVEKKGQLENTIVVFTADHGEMLGDHGFLTKSLPYEAALRIPMIVSGPGIAGGRSSDALVELNDLHPTLCDLAGVPDLPRVDAESFVNVLDDEAAEHRGEALAELEQFRTIRMQEWKYVQNPNAGDELYDLVNDPHELRNVAATEPGVRREMRRRLRARIGRP